MFTDQEPDAPQAMSETGRSLFKQALVDFRLHPETHEQAVWICRTACCLAGSVVLAAGDHPVFSSVNSTNASEVRVPTDGNDMGYTIEYVADRARELLGVTVMDARVLFSARNTIDDLEAMYGVLDANEHLVTTCSDRRCGARVISDAFKLSIPNYGAYVDAFDQHAYDCISRRRFFTNPTLPPSE